MPFSFSNLFCVLSATLDSEQLAVLLGCLKDRDPLNYDNWGLALQCLQKLTRTDAQRRAIGGDTAIHQELVKLVEWPVASKVLGSQNIQTIFAILVALLEDSQLHSRTQPSNELLTKLSEVAASIWITWNKDEAIVKLARRILVVVNPDSDNDDDDSEEDGPPVQQTFTDGQDCDALTTHGNSHPLSSSQSEQHTAPSYPPHIPSRPILTEVATYKAERGFKLRAWRERRQLERQRSSGIMFANRGIPHVSSNKEEARSGSLAPKLDTENKANV